MGRAATVSKPSPGHFGTYEARRMDILRRVALVFAEDGYHETSVNSLSVRLGVSKPMLYYYAKNKDDLLYQCGNVAREALLKAIADARAVEMPGIERVRRFFTHYAQIMCGDFGRCLAVIDRKALSPRARKKDALARREVEAALQKMIREGQADGSIVKRDPVLTSRALFGAFNGIPHWYRPDGALDAKDIADSYMDLFVSGMGRR